MSQDEKQSISRRDILKLGASQAVLLFGAQFFFGARVSAQAQETFLKSPMADLMKRLPNFDGIFYTDVNHLVPFESDFGRSENPADFVPTGVLQAVNSKDIQKMLHFCSTHKIPVTMRGTGGAAYGQTLIHQGIVIDSHTSMKRIRWFNESAGLVELSPGLEWGEVLNFTKDKNRCPHVLPDTIVTSVGGKMNVGGIGETSYFLGSMIDHVVEFDLVTTEGELLHCSRFMNSEIFKAALGSMGQLGMITRVVMKTMLMPKEVYTWEMSYTKDAQNNYLDTVLKDLENFARSESFGAVGGHFVQKLGFNYVVDYTSSNPNPEWLKQLGTTAPAAPLTRSYFDYADRNTAGWQAALASGFLNNPHPYMGCFVPANSIKDLLTFIFSNDLANRTTFKIFLMPLLTKNFSKEFSFELPDGELVYHLRLYRNVTSGVLSAEHLQVLDYQKTTLIPMILQAGGKMYLPFSSILNCDQLEAQLGAHKLERLAKLKSKLDPQHLFNKGAGIF